MANQPTPESMSNDDLVRMLRFRASYADGAEEVQAEILRRMRPPVPPGELAEMRESAERLAEWFEDASSRYDDPLEDGKPVLFATNRHTRRRTEVDAGDIRKVIKLCQLMTK